MKFKVKRVPVRKCQKCRGRRRRDAIYGDLCGHHYASEVDKFMKASRVSAKRYVVK